LLADDRSRVRQEAECYAYEANPGAGAGHFQRADVDHAKATTHYGGRFEDRPGNMVPSGVGVVEKTSENHGERRGGVDSIGDQIANGALVLDTTI
jgi:hypothetical protein